MHNVCKKTSKEEGMQEIYQGTMQYCMLKYPGNNQECMHEK